MIYLLPTGSSINDMPANFGIMSSFNHWSSISPIEEGRPWAADNAAFTDGFKPIVFFEWLKQMKKYQGTCLFVVAPDFLGNSIATLDSFRYWAWRIKALNYPVAFVAQDGQESYPFPPKFDWLFIGGTTEWKLGKGASICINRAQRMGKPVHVGRVNSLKRVKLFLLHGVDSVDGTHLIYEPDQAKRRLIGWMAYEPLFRLES